jgi:hypothetical protein
MLSDPEAIVNGCVPTCGIETRRSPDPFRGHSGDFFDLFGRVLGLRNELLPLAILPRVTSFQGKRVIGQPFCYNDVS